MKIFRPAQPFTSEFAQCGTLGTWPEPCGVCGRGYGMLRPPLSIEWDAGSDLVADFTWVCGTRAMVVTERAASCLEAWGVSGYRLAPVEMSQEKRLRRPTRMTARTRRRVWLPYEGPPLFHLVVTSGVEADLRFSSTRALHPRCAVCGFEDRQATGVEDWEDADPDGDGLYKHVPRQHGKGLFIEARRLSDRQFFNVANVLAWPLCTEPVMRLVEESNLTNITFLEWGETLERPRDARG